MKYRKIIATVLLFYLVLVLEAPITFNGENAYVDQQGYIESGKEGLKSLDASGDFTKEKTNTEENRLSLEALGEEETLEETLNAFNPEVNVTGNYVGENTNGIIGEYNSSITLPGNGEYSIEGNVTNLESQYIQNPGAEEQSKFYAEDATNVGLGLERIEETDSLEGNYAWKFYSYNMESITYALYQKDLPLYNTDTKISYSYFLVSNSSLQNVVNSSLIFDFVFDTCRIMIIHWHHTNIDPPSIGDNTTSPFIVYRLLQNSSWNDQWNHYSLSISDLFTEGDPFIPTMMKSFGIYVISPEISECTVLIDEFQVKTSVTPSDIDLRINDIQISSTGPGTGSIEAVILFEDDAPYEYNIIWTYNSNNSIEGNFTVRSSGTVEIAYEKQILFYNVSTLLYSINILDLSPLIDQINITYPDLWVIFGNPTGADIISVDDLSNGYKILTLAIREAIFTIKCDFTVINHIVDVNYENTTIFEVLNASFEFQEPVSSTFIYIFWTKRETGGSTCEMVDNNILYSFPPWITDGNIDITFLILDGDYIGYRNSTINLLRKPASMTVEEQIDIPKYAIKELGVSYLSLDQYSEIENAIIYANIDGEIIQAIKQDEEYIILISSFYLTQNEYIVKIQAESQTHSTITKYVNITIYESEILIDLQHELSDNPSEYILNFNISSSGLPVGYAPISIEINHNDQYTGITEANGLFIYIAELPLDLLLVNVTCTIFKVSQIVATRTFEIEFENTLVEAERSAEDVLVATNITLTYDINYSLTHDRWTFMIEEEMVPILDAYIETQALRIPVNWDANAFYWQIQASEETNDHKLVIMTNGPNFEATNEENEDSITIHFIISTETKGYSNLSVLYQLNESYATSKYEWKLVTNNQNDVTEFYSLEVNDLYVYFTNLDIVQGSSLILDLVGNKNNQANSITNLIIPVVASTSVLLGVITAGIKIYNKKKGMILEI